LRFAKGTLDLFDFHIYGIYFLHEIVLACINTQF